MSNLPSLFLHPIIILWLIDKCRITCREKRAVQAIIGILNSPVKAWHCAAAELLGRLIINPDNEPFLLPFFPKVNFLCMFYPVNWLFKHLLSLQICLLLFVVAIFCLFLVRESCNFAFGSCSFISYNIYLCLNLSL